MDILLEKANIENKHIMSNMMQLYLHDITSGDFSGIEMMKMDYIHIQIWKIIGEMMILFHILLKLMIKLSALCY